MMGELFMTDGAVNNAMVGVFLLSVMIFSVFVVYASGPGDPIETLILGLVGGFIGAMVGFAIVAFVIALGPVISAVSLVIAIIPAVVATVKRWLS